MTAANDEKAPIESKRSLLTALGIPYRWISKKIKMLKKRPLWVAIVLILMSLAIALGVWGVVAASDAEASSRQQIATTAATQKALNVKKVIDSAFNPIISIATLIKRDPKNWTRLNETFYKVANDVFLQSGVVFNVQLVPNGVIMSVVPITGFQGTVTLDLMKSPVFRPDMLKAIIGNTTTMSGPNPLQIGIYGLAGRYPIFVPDVDPDETFGFQEVLRGPPGWGLYRNGTYDPGSFNRSIYSAKGGNCPFNYCYRNETSSKFWGVAALIIGWERAKDLAGLYDLCGQYDFMMTYTSPAGVPNFPIAQCADTRNIPTKLLASTGGNITTGVYGPLTLADYLPRKPVNVKIQALNNEWTLYVVDSRGWTPAYKTGLIAGVVLASVLVTLIILLLISSHLEQEELLEETEAAHKRLEETKSILEAEKIHADALVARQLNLISCFSDVNMGSSSGRPRNSLEASTLERIEAVRRTLNAGQNEGEEIQIVELLGSGSFGKVYRGFWRGTEVAIKTIILPANMNANAKREKMAIMEAAISSSLMHPNITQVFTYSFRPIKDSMAISDKGEFGSLLKVAPTGSTFISSISSKLVPTVEESSGQIFSFEVRLVMEYCDLGCLREALDLGIFGADTHKFNYAAVLDTLLDVAKAMMHLHKSNVLHMDLKARNVMIKSDGSDPRGVVAKVADFGLSVSLDSTQTHMSSMYQGTITHMAPEILMKGYVSKAADVYAFGITMYEIYTEKTAYSEVPAPHMGHSITAGRVRPMFPESTPRDFQELAACCWTSDPEARPSFVSVHEKLLALRAKVAKVTPSVDLSLLPNSKSSSDQREALQKINPSSSDGSSQVTTAGKIVQSTRIS